MEGSAEKSQSTLCRWGVNIWMGEEENFLSLADLGVEDGELFGLEGCSFLDQTLTAVDFDPVGDGVLTSSQVPVVFSGLLDGAKDSGVEDSEEKRVLFSMENADSPVESEEEQACFDLVSDSNEGEPIPCTQPCYNIKEMWW